MFIEPKKINISEIGFDDFFRANCTGGELLPGRVISESKNVFTLISSYGEIPAEASGRLIYSAMGREDLPAVGDWIEFSPVDDFTRGIVHRILPRKTSLKRKAVGKATDSQVIAANIDMVFIVQGLDGNFNPRRLERYIIAVKASGANPVVLLSKSDICTPEEIETFISRAKEVVKDADIFVYSSHDAVSMESIGEKRNIKAVMYAIDNNYIVNPEEIDERTLVGFLAPTHGFNIAPAMLRFIMKFPAGKKTDVFILNTRAGLKFFNLFIPGLSGAAQFLPMIILKLKGYAIAGGLPLDMPSNWIFLHSGLNSAKVESIVERCKEKTNEFAKKILNSEKVFSKTLISLPLDIIVSPVAFVYYIYARFVLAKTMIYADNCNNCGICVDNCPVNAIKIINNRPYWTFSCESCMRCINFCPRSSIQTSHLIFVLILIISSISFNFIFLKYIQLPQFLNSGIILSGIKMAITLIELFFLYAVVQRILRFKFIAILFKYTSLSNYWRKYRAPGISIKDFIITKKNEKMKKQKNGKTEKMNN